MKNLVWYILFFYGLVCVFTVSYFNGTADDGDSIAHYLFARYAPAHPKLYFDHWAKPLFVLLASPFAQFGFTGIKVFNAILSFSTIFVTYRIAVQSGIKNAVLVIVIMIFSPLYYILTFSGLTEPLFALLLALGIYCCITHHYISGSLIISFLPYVRSEGLIIIGVFFLYFIFKNAWRCIPLLLTGSLLYAVAGYFVNHNLLWVFTKIPYATLKSVYGSGPPFHFVVELINVLGVPLYALFWIGFILIIIRTFQKKTGPEDQILLLMGFCAFFIAHSLFWYFGIFASMGLKRVFIGVMPIMALITLQGFNFLTEEFFAKKNVKTTIGAILVFYILVFPFTPNPSAVQWKRDMTLNEDQEMAVRIGDNIGRLSGITYPVLFHHHYLSVVLDLDYFEPTQCNKISREEILKMKNGGIVVWDSQFASVESNISRSELDTLGFLTKICDLKTTTRSGKEMEFVLYQKNTR